MRQRGHRRWGLLASAVLLVAAASIAGVKVLGDTVLAIGPDSPRDVSPPTREYDRCCPLRLTVLGTSLSATNRYGWPDEVGIRLAERIGHAVEVRRVAQPGASSTWGADQVGRVLATDPDVVLVEFATNDADVRRRLTVDASVARHEQILSGLQDGGRGPAVVLLTMSPASGPRALLRPTLGRYYAEYVDLAERHHAGLVDLYPRWNALSPKEQELLDGLHPSNAAATRVVVDPVVEALAGALTRGA